MADGADLDSRLRAAMFAHLSRISTAHPDGIPSDVINSFVFDGAPMRLIVQPGIRKPAQLQAALTIRTTWTAPGGSSGAAAEARGWWRERQHVSRIRGCGGLQLQGGNGASRARAHG